MADYDLANDIWPKDIPAITRAEATKAAALLIRRFARKSDMPPNAIGLPGSARRVRTCWVCLSGETNTLHKGWRRLVHDLSHRIHVYRFPRFASHNEQHAKFEAEMAAYVLAQGWLTGTLKAAPKAAPTLEEARAERLANTRAKLARWQTKLRRAQTAIKKLRAAEKRQARVLASPPPPPA